ncbi:hypothetical protein MIR68_009776 [Amoeboaphelidium protococcarum]|nr:hypothetical protein MIR68_009776 [Amoeboaphelidium protococcarum]
MQMLRDWNKGENAHFADRVSQLEGLQLDREIQDLFVGEFKQLSYMVSFDLINRNVIQSNAKFVKSRQNRSLYKFTPEITLLVRGALLSYLFKSGARWGDVMQNVEPVRRADGSFLSRGTLRWYAIYLSVLPWIRERIQLYIQREGWSDYARDEWQRIVWTWWNMAEKLLDLCHLINFILFLRTGMYRSLVHRCLGIVMYKSDIDASRALDLEYVNRLMVWTSLGEFATSILPLINVGRIRSVIGIFRQSKSSKLSSLQLKLLKELPSCVCGFCLLRYEHKNQNTTSIADLSQNSRNYVIVNAYVSVKCGHSFCYACLYEAHRDGSTCCRCQTSIEDIRPLNAQSDPAESMKNLEKIVKQHTRISDNDLKAQNKM